MTKTVEEVRRAAFKKWFDSLPWVMCEKCSGDKEIAWRGFNAALAAVEIELPKPAYPPSLTGEGLMLDKQEMVTILKCRAAIEQTGLGLRIK